jgi:lipopolysaccharide export system protein LptC
VSNKPVRVKLLQGTLDANRLEIVNSGDLVRFDGGVNMTLMLTEAAAKTAAPAQAEGEAQ